MKQEQRTTSAEIAQRTQPRAWFLIRTLLVVVLVGAIGWAAWQRFVPKPPMPDLNGLDAEVVDAITAARDQVRWWPWSAERWGQLGMVLYAHDINKEALLCLQEAEGLDHEDFRWPYYQGRLLMSERPDASVPCFQRAVARKADPLTFQRLGDALLNVDRPQEAEGAFHQMLRAQPMSARAVQGLGQVNVRRGDWHGAITQLTRISASPEVRKAAHRLLAEAYQRIGETAKAAAALERFAALPDDPPLDDPYDEAISILRVGVTARMERARRLEHSDRIPEAIQVLEETTQKYPQFLFARLLLGRLYLQQNNLPKAEEQLREALRIEPHSTAGLIDLGKLHERKGNFTEALKRYREAADAKPDAFRAHYWMGQCLLKLGDKKGALDAFREVVRIEPDLADAQIQLGALLHDAGNDSEAVQHLNYALKLSPDNGKATRLLEEINKK